MIHPPNGGAGEGTDAADGWDERIRAVDPHRGDPTHRSCAGILETAPDVAVKRLASGALRQTVASTSGPAGINARTASMLSACAGSLSGRYRTTRANRRATPPG